MATTVVMVSEDSGVRKNNIADMYQYLRKPETLIAKLERDL